jgi:hypothetical protein
MDLLQVHEQEGLATRKWRCCADRERDQVHSRWPAEPCVLPRHGGHPGLSPYGHQTIDDLDLLPEVLP